MRLEFHQLDRRWQHLRVHDPHQHRRLLGSLPENGQQTPIVTVAASDDTGRYVVIDGYKRIAALQQPGRDTVEATLWTVGEAEALLLDRSRIGACSAARSNSIPPPCGSLLLLSWERRPTIANFAANHHAHRVSSTTTTTGWGYMSQVDIQLRVFRYTEGAGRRPEVGTIVRALNHSAVVCGRFSPNGMSNLGGADALRFSRRQ